MATWTAPVGRVLGVPLRIHATLPLAIGLLILLRMDGGVVDLALVVALVSLSLFLHEIGHAVAARRFGATIHAVILFPLRATAVVEGANLPFRRQIGVAFAGPAANAILAIGIWAFFAFHGMPTFALTASHHVPHADLLTRLCLINGLLCAVNLLPALPFDGGQALLALLSSRIGRRRAIPAVVQISLILACGIGLAAFVVHLPILSIVGLFIGIGTSREAHLYREYLGRVTDERVEEAVYRDVKTLRCGETLHHAGAALTGNSQRIFPVLQGAEVIGILSRQKLAGYLARKDDDKYVAEAMDRKFLSVQESSPLRDAIPLLHQTPTCSVVVLSGDRLAGVVTVESVRMFLTERAAKVNEQDAGQSVNSDFPRRDGA